MKEWKTWCWSKLDQSIIVYRVLDGKVFGGSDPNRTVKHVQKDYDGCDSACDYTMELDLSNRTLVMKVDNQKIILDRNIGDFEYSPIVILNFRAPAITLL